MIVNQTTDMEFLQKLLKNLPGKRKKIALSLSGGGGKSIMYLGVIKAFIENGIPIDMIGGFSGGAIFAAAYSIFKDTNIIYDKVSAFSFRADHNPFDGYSIMDEIKYREDLDISFEHKTTDDFKIPTLIFATNYESRKTEILNNCNISDALVASAALPPLLMPHKIHNKKYVDGGFSIKYGAKYFRELGADIVIGIDAKQFAGNLFVEQIDAVFKSVNITIQKLAEFEQIYDPVDFQFTLDADLLGINFLKFMKNKDSMYSSGYERTLDHVHTIKRIIK